MTLNRYVEITIKKRSFLRSFLRSFFGQFMVNFLLISGPMPSHQHRCRTLWKVNTPIACPTSLHVDWDPGAPLPDKLAVNVPVAVNVRVNISMATVNDLLSQGLLSTNASLTAEDKWSSGYLKAVWFEMFGPAFSWIFGRSRPGTPLDRRGPPRTSIYKKNQLRRPILRPFRGT